MKALIDTHVFLWVITTPEKLSKKALQLIENRSNDIFLSPVSCWEIVIKYQINKLDLPENPNGLILEQIKEDIFEFTGGHRMLHEISQILTILDSANSLNDLMDEEEQSSKSIKDHLEERIPFWINKLMVKN